MGPLPQAMTADDSRPMNRKIAWTLRDADAPVRLDVAVAGNLDGINRSRARQLIEDGFVSVTGRAVRRGSSQVICGDEVVVELTDDAGTRADSPRAEFDVAFEDEHLIVVDKPAGVTVHPGPGHRGDTLIEGLIASRPELAAVGDPGAPRDSAPPRQGHFGITRNRQNRRGPGGPDQCNEGPGYRPNVHCPCSRPDQPGPGRCRRPNRPRPGQSNSPGGGNFRQAGENKVSSLEVDARRIVT